MFYIEKGGVPVPVDDPVEAMRDSAPHAVAKTDLGHVFVSTVFIGIDHNFGDYGPPILYETMVFPGKDGRVTDYIDLDCSRYATREAAKAGHEEMCATWRDRPVPTPEEEE